MMASLKQQTTLYLAQPQSELQTRSQAEKQNKLQVHPDELR
jgi:hypothetical protein